jgi:hypothetical protein
MRATVRREVCLVRRETSLLSTEFVHVHKLVLAGTKVRRYFRTFVDRIRRLRCDISGK